MPNVTAPTRRDPNGQSSTYFLDSVSTTNTTYTYPAQQDALIVTNRGDYPITLTVNGTAYTIQGGGVQSVAQLFTLFTIVATGQTAFDALAISGTTNSVQLTGSNVQQDGSVKTTMTTALSKDLDTIDVAKMSKGGASTPFTTSITATSAEVPCVGYNSVIVHISGIAGTWDISVQNATITGGVFVDAYDDRAAQMKASGVTAGRSILFRGVLDAVKIVATNVVAGSVTVKVVPLNL